ncbi:MAG: hypothetical protein ACFCVC_07450 [Acidimicrobiia bacterium]
MRRLLAIASLGLLTFSVSESMFWGSWTAAYSGPDVVFTILAYTIVVVAVLFCLERLRPAGRNGVFLGGALLGWLVEGTIVATTYEALPLSIAWTGLAWHALLSVLGAWVVLPRILAMPLRPRIAALAAVGVAWGSWAAAMQADTGVLDAPLTFAAYVGLCTLGMGLGLAGWLRWRSDHLVPTWLGWSAFAMLAAAFVFQAIALPIALVVLPVLLGSALWAMKQRPAAAAAHLDPVAHSGHPRLMWLGLMPVAAWLCWLLVGPGIAPLAAPVIYILTNTAGLLLLGRALWQARPRRVSPVVSLPVEA